MILPMRCCYYGNCGLKTQQITGVKTGVSPFLPEFSHLAKTHVRPVKAKELASPTGFEPVLPP